jgi:hypothetical protein
MRKYNLHQKLRSITDQLGSDAQDVMDWATEEAERRIDEGELPHNYSVGKAIYELIGTEAAIRLVQENHARGRLTTKSEIKKKTGRNPEMPVLYRQAGLRHPQEARNLRHNMFHCSFDALVDKLFSDVDTDVPTTGNGLTPDLIITSSNPGWQISVEYKGYRSLTLLSESEILKGMRYQAEYGTAWLVTSTSKTVKELYGKMLTAKELIDRGVPRLRRIARRRAYTNEQKENRGIARKGIGHLEKHKGSDLKCRFLSAEEIIESCQNGRPKKGLAVSNGMEYVNLLVENGLHEHAENVLRIMKSPADLLHSDTITSVRLIE